MEETSSNKRIAKNALMLYIRMFLTMIVGLYTSRVVLATLGVEDYGIYGVVGGVVSMMGFLNASMSGATSRFLTFELGRGDRQRLADTFSSALIVHIGIAIVVFIVAETVGLWFLCNKLVIPEGRMTAAHWVFQCSILSAMLSITQAPYNASIIAHEKMGVYAYVEILNVTLKLLIVYLLVIGNFDKLKLYAILTLAVSVVIMLIYRIYCIRRFPETHFHFLWNKQIMTQLVSFSGWNIFSNLGWYFQSQGTIFLINIFFGVVVNAAASIGTTLSNAVNSFASNVMTAFRPAIIKSYSSGNINRMTDLTKLALVVILYIYSLVGIPLYIGVNSVLELWLIEVPNYSSAFCRILLINTFFEVARLVLLINIHATGKVKVVSALIGFSYLILPLLSYVLLRFGIGKYTPYFILISINIIGCIINISFIKKYVMISIRQYYKVIFKILVSIGLALVLSEFVKVLISQYITSKIIDLIVVSIVSVIITSMLYVWLCLNRVQRTLIFAWTTHRMRKFL